MRLAHQHCARVRGVGQTIVLTSPTVGIYYLNVRCHDQAALTSIHLHSSPSMSDDHSDDHSSSSADMSDDDFRLESPAPSNAETSRTTPSQRVIDNSMSVAAKRRVDHATENLTGKRCLIEGTDESNAVEYAHCLPRATKPPRVSLPPRGLPGPSLGRH